MAVRTVTVALNANVAGFQAAMGRASSAADKFAKDTQTKVSGAMTAADKYGASFEKVGGALTKVGIAGAAALTLVSKAAMDWESDFAGVRKTVDATEEQYAELNDQLREMARTLPASHHEIAAVAEAAGQLGIAREDVAKFSRTMIDLGETTNLSADEAATTLARFSNIMGTATSDVDRLGSVLVGLGNNFATTEAEIAEMGMRLAGAGRQVGMTESDVLGLSAALTSVGIRAEAGGTALSRFMLRMEADVRSGGDSLNLLAETAGVSASEFKRVFEEDAAQALEMFTSGLGRVQAAGGDTSAILADLGAKGIRESDALRRLASSGDLLASALEMGSTEWERNLALVEEATQRYNTTESKVRVAWNNIKDAAISAGQSMLPVIQQIAEGVASLAQWFGSLSPGVMTAMAATTVLVTGLALVGGAILTLLPKIVAMRAAVTDIGKAFPGMAAGATRAAGAMRKAAGAASAFGLAASAGALAGKVVANFQPKTKPVEDYTTALLAMAKGGEGAADSMNKLLDDGVWGEGGTQVKDLTSAFKQLQENMNFVNNTISKMGDVFGGVKSSQRLVQEQFEAMDEALASMDSTQAVKAFQEIRKSAEEAGMSNETLLDTFPQYKTRLQELANQLQVTNLSAEDYVKWMGGEVPEAVLAAAKGNKEAEDAISRASGEMRDAAKAAELAAEANEKYLESLETLAEAAMAAMDAEIGWRQSIDDAAGALKDTRKQLVDKYVEQGKSIEQAKKMADADIKAGKALDLRTQIGRDNRKMLNNLISDGKDWISTLEDEETQLRENGASSDEVRRKSKELDKAKQEVAAEIARVARELGMEADEAFNLMKRLNAIPDKVSTKILLPGVKGSQKQADDLNKRIKELDARDRLEIIAEWMTKGYDAAKRKYDSLTSKSVTVSINPHMNSLTGNTNLGRIGGKDIYLPYADGGPIRGSSPHPRADNMLIRATAGEFMMRHAAHTKYGTDSLSAINRGDVDPTALSRLVKGFADGGPVSQGAPNMVPGRFMSETSLGVVPAGSTTQHISFNLPNVNPYAALMAAGNRIGGLS